MVEGGGSEFLCHPRVSARRCAGIPYESGEVLVAPEGSRETCPYSLLVLYFLFSVSMLPVTVLYSYFLLFCTVFWFGLAKCGPETVSHTRDYHMNSGGRRWLGGRGQARGHDRNPSS